MNHASRYSFVPALPDQKGFANRLDIFVDQLDLTFDIVNGLFSLHETERIIIAFRFKQIVFNINQMNLQDKSTHFDSIHEMQFDFDQSNACFYGLYFIVDRKVV